MKKLKISQLMMTVALTAFVAGHAFAATPKTESVITHDKITLGDVFDGITENTGYYLAPAPQLGQTVTLNAHDLTRISEAFNLGWKPESQLDHVVIRRSSSEISRFDIQAALQQQLADELKGKKFEMELADRSTSFRIPESGDKTLKVEDMSYDMAKGTFRAVVGPEAAPALKKEVKGKFYTVSKIPVLRDPLRPGDIITANDIDYIDMRAPDITANMVTDADKLIGQTPRRGVNALKPLVAGDIQLPVVVKKGDFVTMTLQSGLLSLTAKGRALSNGAEGDVIQVLNPSSKQVVDAIVTGAQAVSVKPVTMNTL